MAERLAIFGGTFDPIHLAHLRAAQEVAEQLDFSGVVFMPSAEPPHHKTVGAGAQDRLAMVRLAVESNPLFRASDLEARRGGPSYTLHTLNEIKAAHPEADLYFLIGADAFFHVHTWHKPMEVFKLADFVIMDRPGTPRGDILDYLRRNLDPGFAPAKGGWVRGPYGHGAMRLQTRLLDISSSDIKRRVAAGLSIAYLVPPAVADYIRDMKLYRTPGAQR